MKRKRHTILPRPASKPAGRAGLFARAARDLRANAADGSIIIVLLLAMVAMSTFVMLAAIPFQTERRSLRRTYVKSLSANAAESGFVLARRVARKELSEDGRTVSLLAEREFSSFVIIAWSTEEDIPRIVSTGTAIDHAAGLTCRLVIHAAFSAGDPTGAITAFSEEPMDCRKEGMKSAMADPP